MALSAVLLRVPADKTRCASTDFAERTSGRAALRAERKAELEMQTLSLNSRP
jgi:hypothetical protein